MHLNIHGLHAVLQRWKVPPWRTLLWRITLYSGLWWVLTEGTGSVWIGVPLALAIALCAPLNTNTWSAHLRWWKLPAFIGFMVKLSVSGAVEVAKLALSRRCDANTHTRVYYFRLLTYPSHQLLMANLVNLTPGTLTLRISDDTLYIHILHHPQIAAQLRELESRIAELYGLKHGR
ncbi:Na+/H+ antiporter subunit E [Vreelandella alkaliphila]|uniref:Na+/H+ antiporter subunit E n=1 Tax=Vreelandella alkaliphila TaxID=272774 RepID=A0A7C9NPH5_9GAMM|nr:Na+/H+ antiporter subunit E [Halomonas alkaliphila]NDL70188.1 Na+/H+ antiporter subunit E [Halomonas alkaliphila]